MSATTQAPRRLATVQDASALYGIHPNTLRRRLKDRTITAYRLAGGRAIRVDLDELDRVLMRRDEATQRISDDGSASSTDTSDHDCWLQQVIAKAPPLTREQRDRIAAILRGGDAA